MAELADQTDELESSHSNIFQSVYSNTDYGQRFDGSDLMEYQIIEKIPQVGEYQFLRTSVGWHNHSTTVAAQSLNNSIYSVCAVSENNVIGFGRVVGDGYIYFYLQDVIVLPKYQGRGIGYKITENITNHVLSIAQPGAFLGLMAAAGASSMYEKFDFKCRPPHMPGMFRWIGTD